MIKAIFYDLDGVLVDAVKIHRHAFDHALSLVSGFRLTDDEHELTFNGLPTKKKLEMLVQDGRVDPTKVKEIEELKQKETVRFIDKFIKEDADKAALHYWARRCGIKIACVTNSIRHTAELMLERSGQRHLIDLLVTNEDVVHPKPSPEPYLRAMAMLRIGPHEGLAVEDSAKGMESANATKMLHVFHVPCSSAVHIKSISEAIIKIINK
jgi:HAD superfamily hydrolase (TIGR01509 family)